MRKTISRLFLVAIISLMGYACNPECESLPAGNVVLPQGPYQAGTELLISSNPAGFLEGRKILLSSGATGEDPLELRSEFEAAVGGTIVTIPDEISSNAAFLIDDPDCTGQFIPIGSTTNIVDESFFVDNPFFVTPFPPLIIIPTTPPNPPPLVVDAWFSPNNRDYCIWFKPDEDSNGNEKPNLIPGVVEGKSTIIVGPPEGSLELAVGCSATGPADDRIYHANPVTGVVDKENNFIKIQVDRTSKGLGVEEYIGQFIDPDSLPESEYSEGGVCDGNSTQKPNIMFLTSQLTGRQMILFRGDD